MKKRMTRGKRLAALVLALAMSATLVSCGGQDDPAGNTGTGTPSTGTSGGDETYVISVNTALSGSGGTGGSMGWAASRPWPGRAGRV